MKTGHFNYICGEVIQLLLKYCIYCVSAPFLYRESTDSLRSIPSCPIGQATIDRLWAVSNVSCSIILASF